MPTEYHLEQQAMAQTSPSSGQSNAGRFINLQVTSVYSPTQPKPLIGSGNLHEHLCLNNSENSVMSKRTLLSPYLTLSCAIILASGCFGPAQETREEVHGPERDELAVSSEAPSSTTSHNNSKPKIKGVDLFRPDLRLIYTTAGFGWRTTDESEENSCNMCRAGTPIVLANRPKRTGDKPDECDVELLGLEGDITGLLALLFDTRSVYRELGVHLSYPWLTDSHARIIHGMITHPREDIRGAALHLAGRSQMNMFLPELSKACRQGERLEQEGAIRGVHALNSLGGQTLAKEFPLGTPNTNAKKRPEGLEETCPGPAKLAPGGTDSAVSSMALAAYAYAQKEPSNMKHVASSPPLIKFASLSGQYAARGDVDGLRRQRQALHTLLTFGPGCVTHVCDWLLLDALDASILSLSPTKR